MRQPFIPASKDCQNFSAFNRSLPSNYANHSSLSRRFCGCVGPWVLWVHGHRTFRSRAKRSANIWGEGFWGVHRIGPHTRGHSPEQNPSNEFLVQKREIVPQHKFCVHVIHAPKAEFDSRGTARLTTTTRTLPIPESGSSIRNQNPLIYRKTVHKPGQP